MLSQLKERNMNRKNIFRQGLVQKAEEEKAKAILEKYTRDRKGKVMIRKNVDKDR